MRELERWQSAAKMVCPSVPRVDKLQEEQGRRAAAEASATQLKQQCAELQTRARLLEQQVCGRLHACKDGTALVTLGGHGA